MIAIKSRVDANPGATILISGPAQFTQTPDQLAPFNSIGPTLENVLKPDVSAPGENIYSAAIKACNKRVFRIRADSHRRAGPVRLLPMSPAARPSSNSFTPQWTVAQVKSALVNSPVAPVIAAANSKKPADVLAAGNGRLDLSLAFSVGATLAPANLSFGVNSLKKMKQSVTVVQNLNITSVLPTTTTCNVKVDPMPADGITMTQSVRSISLAAGQTGQVQITISAAKGAPRGDLTGFVIVAHGTGQLLTVPFWVRF